MWGNTVSRKNHVQKHYSNPQCFFFKKKTTKLNYQPTQYEKKLKLTKTILEKKNHMEKHCSNQQCFKDKTTELNSQPAQY